MSFSKDLALKNATRNEAKEASAIIRDVQTEILTEWKNTDSDESAKVLSDWSDRLKRAVELVEKFSEKHAPEPQRWK